MSTTAQDILPPDCESDAPLEEGDIVGEYRVERAIGHGGFGTVYRAAHPLIGKVVAIKVLKREFSAKRETVARFVAEARAVNKIQHKNIIDIWSFGRLADGRHYYAMEYLEGCTLGEALAQEGPFDPAEALAVFGQLGQALAAANAQGIIHRDLKPDNIFLVNASGGGTTVKLLDFGIAKLLDPLGLGNETQAGATLGTPAYMSPEQVHGEPCDERADIYAFGVLLHEVLTGAPPLVGHSPAATLARQVRDLPPAVSACAPTLGTAFDAPVLHMLEKDREKRPPTVLAALEELFAAADEAGVAVPESLSRAASHKWSAYLATSTRSVERTPRTSRTPSSLTAAMRTGRASVPDAPTLPIAAAAATHTLSASAPPPPPPAASNTWKLVVAAAAVAVAGLVAWRGTAKPPAPATPAASSAPATVALKVTSDPPGAMVSLDGVELGRTPLTTTVAREDRAREIVLSAAGFAPHRTRVSPTQDLAVSASLAPEPTQAKPSAEPQQTAAPRGEAPARAEPAKASPRPEPAKAAGPAGLGVPGKPTARPLDERDPWK